MILNNLLRFPGAKVREMGLKTDILKGKLLKKYQPDYFPKIDDKLQVPAFTKPLSSGISFATS